MTGPSWAILVPTLGQRRTEFRRLMTGLLPQLAAHDGAVRVLGYWNNGERPLPHIRQALVDAAGAAGFEYMTFVDDDDRVPEYYVTETMTALAQRPAYVGWQVQCYTNGHPTALAYHSLAFEGWYGEAGLLYRDISHLNPVRVDLVAGVADFRECPPGQPEDRAWAAQLRGRLDGEVLIDKVMYHYLWSPRASSWRRPERIQRTGHTRVPVANPHFSWLEDLRA